MTDYISRDAAVEAVKNERKYIGKYSFEEEHAWSVGFQQGITFALSDICALPAADVVERASGIIGEIPSVEMREVKRGKWELNALESVATCSECECCIPTLWKDPDICWNFCPNCGTDMREEQT